MYKRNKYNAIKVKDDGMTFDSKREHARYLYNKQRLKDGEISDLEIPCLPVDIALYFQKIYLSVRLTCIKWKKDRLP